MRHALVLSRQGKGLDYLTDQLYGVASGLRALWLPVPSDTTTTTSSSRVWTYDGDISARITPQGNGVVVSFSGTAQFANTPDTADMSFGNGTADSPVSFVALANVTNTAGERPILTKWASDGGVAEYQFNINTDDTLRLIMEDASAVADASRSSNAAITQGALHLLAATYDGGGGATAANGVTLYQDAAAIASTATNNASYVAMENGTSSVDLAAVDDEAAVFTGSLGFVAVYASELTAEQVAAIVSICREVYGVPL